MASITDINGIAVHVTINSKLNVNKGLIYIYIYNYSMCDYQAFRTGLIKQHDLQDIVEPHWIRQRQNGKGKHFY